MAIELQYGPNPGVVGMAAFAGGQGKRQNDAARQYMPLVEQQNQQRFAIQQQQKDWEHEYRLAMAHLAASGVTAAMHQQFTAQQNALNRQSRERAAALAHPEQKPVAPNPFEQGGQQQIEDAGDEIEDAGDGQVQSVGPDPNHPSWMGNVMGGYAQAMGGTTANVMGGYAQAMGDTTGNVMGGYAQAMGGTTAMMPSFTGPGLDPQSAANRGEASGAHEAVRRDEAQKYRQHQEAHLQRPETSLGQTGENMGMGYGSMLPNDFFGQQTRNDQAFERGMAGGPQPGEHPWQPNLGITGHSAQDRYAATLAQTQGAAANPGFWYNQPGAGQVTQESQDTAAGGLAAKGYVKGPQGWYKPQAKAAPQMDLPTAPEQDPRQLANNGLVPLLPDKYQELYSLYQQIME
jgi:hypothetical protein